MNSKEQMFDNVIVGKAMSYSVGSDRYGFWISYVNKKDGIIGLYEPPHMFEHDWTDGYMKFEMFDSTKKPSHFYKAFRGKWYELNERTGKRACYPTHLYLTEVPVFYQDPSF